MSDMIGQTLGPYRLVEQLGAGGMATVFKAYHAAMDRYVAVKILLPHMARDAEVRARFQREARTIARLEHRHILTVHDVGEDNETPYLVMRYTDGGTLGDLIASRQLDVARAVELVRQVASALAYAHQQGVVHRDIKPANVLIDKNGDALLTDFGIAKIIADTMHLTGEGMLIGTPYYMAPEQVKGQPADTRTDVYALGVVLYEASTGQRPFMAETPLAVALMHIHNPLPMPTQINPAIPESLARVILKALAKAPEDRYQTAAELAAALQAIDPRSLAAQPPILAKIYNALQTLDDGGVQSAPAAPPAPPPPAPAAPSLAAATPPTVLLGADDRPPTAETPAPAARTERRRRLVLGGIVLLALLAAAIFLWPSDDDVAVGPGGGGAPLSARPGLQAFTSTRVVFDFATQGDELWAGTSGGLVRWTKDGASRVFTLADGLPFNGVRELLAHPDGSLWIASDLGLARVRPAPAGLAEVTVFTATSGLDSGGVGSLLVDADGSVWAGGIYRGGLSLSRFDGARWQPAPPPATHPALDGLNLNPRSMLRTADGALWLGLEDSGLLRWDGSTWTHFGAAQGLVEPGIWELIQDKAGTLWAATGNGGLLRFDPAAGSWQRVINEVLAENAGVRTISQLPNGDLWASSPDFVARSADGGATWALSERAGERLGWGMDAFAIGPDGQVWAGGQDFVSAFDGSLWRRLPRLADLVSDTRVGALAVAPKGLLWSIPMYGGIPTGVNSENAPAMLSDRELGVNAMAWSDDAMWLATNEGLVALRGERRQRLTVAEGLPSERVTKLLVAGQTLWVGTEQGLAPLDLASLTFGPPVAEFGSWEITALAPGPDGAIWAAAWRRDGEGETALGRYDGKTAQLWTPEEPPFNIAANPVSAIAADADGGIWVAVWSGGLHRWDGKTWRSWTQEDGAPPGSVLAIAVGADGMLFGGQFPNLYRWDRQGWSTVAIDGLPRQVNALHQADGGALWIATEDGLLRYKR